jgi:hypothetical protein
MEMPDSRRAEFFAVLVTVCTVVAAIILIVDYHIKGEILEAIERYREGNGQGNAGPAGLRIDYNGHRDSPLPSDLVYSGNAGMEASGATAANESDQGYFGWADVNSTDASPPIRNGNKQVGA